MMITIVHYRPTRYQYNWCHHDWLLKTLCNSGDLNERKSRIYLGFISVKSCSTRWYVIADNGSQRHKACKSSTALCSSVTSSINRCSANTWSFFSDTNRMCLSAAIYYHAYVDRCQPICTAVPTHISAPLKTTDTFFQRTISDVKDVNKNNGSVGIEQLKVFKRLKWRTKNNGPSKAVY